MAETTYVDELLAIQKKWQLKWEETKIFEANPDNRKKFFVNFPYPYINAYQHIGHLFTLMRVEAFARYKRMNGFNVLFPQGWHATGSPIVNAAQRVKDREPKQIKIMQDMGFAEADFKKFEEPEYWIRFFAPEFEKDYRSLGMSVDWRRNFHTTSLNPHYDKFIQWQFRKLKEKGFVVKGRFPVVWDPKMNAAVGDHDRMQGEGEVPQEFCLFKFTLDDGRKIITATLRPDTVMGITNVFVNPKETYAVVEVTLKDGVEKWIVGKPIVDKLQYQDFKVMQIGEQSGAELIGKDVLAYSGIKIPVLPASFLDSNYGTGMVHSVPSDSADDLIALEDFKKDEARIQKFGLNKEKIQNINPIPVFDTPDIGNCPAKYFLDKYQVKHQNERNKLDEIKKELYKLTYNQARFNEKYAKGFSKNLQGMIVKDGQEIVKRDLVKAGAIHIYYELTGKVVARSLAECVVKIVDDQWFMDYNNPDWKALAHKCLDQMKLYPEKSRDQFNYVIDWLHEWACTREKGLGTKLPWDQKWLIESLSDSTIYTSYYTVAHLIKNIPIEKIDDQLFDYILLGKGQKPNIPHVDEMRKNVEYYYPVDFRNSGKDLIQNHLTFYIFNHVAIFPEHMWPKGIGANGWVTVDGQKMSKSLGNMIPVRDVVKKYSSDVARITILNGGEEMDDPNWDTKFADSMISKLKNLKDFAAENYNKNGRTDVQLIDKWFVSEMNRTLLKVNKSMESTLFRTAIQNVYFELQRILRHYTNRTNGNVNQSAINQFIELQIKVLTPFTPHVCEEAWSLIGKVGFVSNENWPVVDESTIDDHLNAGEEYLSQIMTDVRQVQQLAKLEKLSKITLFVAEDWKYWMFDTVSKELEKGNRDFKSILDMLMKDKNVQQNSKNVTKVLPMLIKKGSETTLAKNAEIVIIKESIPAVEQQFGCKVEFVLAEESELPKAKQAMPGKPAILVE